MGVALIGVWLAALGVADLVRPLEPSSRLRAAVGPAAGVVVLVIGLVLVDMSWPARGVLIPVLGALVVGWTSTASARVSAASLAVGLAVAALCAGVVRADRPWPAWLEGSVPAQFDSSAVLVATGVLAQLSTANLAVRRLLDAVGVPATSNEKQLRGGRVLGPMERVLLVCLGALGAITAAAVVVAAKGLLRFPEIQRVHRDPHTPTDGPSDVTEYFLIGSLASWLLALAGAGLIHLAG